MIYDDPTCQACRLATVRELRALATELGSRGRVDPLPNDVDAFLGLVPPPEHTCALGIAVALSSTMHDILLGPRRGWRPKLARILRKAANRVDRPGVRRPA